MGLPDLPPVFALFEDRFARSGEPAAKLFSGLTAQGALADAGELPGLVEGEGWTVVALDYELGALLEPAARGSVLEMPERVGRWWRFSDCADLDGAQISDWLAQRLNALDGESRSAGIMDLEHGLEASAYRTAVERIRRYIADGDCYQVNFTFPLRFRWFGAPLALYAGLRERQPVRYGGMLVDHGEAIVSLSPELFLERRGRRLTTRPMKGTAPTRESVETLRASEKNRAENLMIVDLLRNDLGRVADTGSVRVDALFEIEEYPTVRQMVSQVSADVSAADFPAILRALFPCGSVTGAPKIRAMQIAAELEVAPRGLYTGAFGWIAPDGDFRLNVPIRTLELDAGGRGRMGIGSGIVADSEAASEWAECRLKAAFLTDFDPGFSLIETLLREDGIYPRLGRHLARLSASAASLGFIYDEASALQALHAQPATGRWRVRLTLRKGGAVEVAAAELHPEPPGPRFARLSHARVDSRYPLRRHKTTVRPLYDAALRDIGGTPDLFDVVFLNERGEVAEGARSNVFVRRDGVWLTPPLASGALPGVLRAELLDSGKAREAVLYPGDLAAGFSLGNALRGLVSIDGLKEG